MRCSNFAKRVNFPLRTFPLAMRLPFFTCFMELLQNLSKKGIVFLTILELYCSYFLVNHLLFSNKLPGKTAFTIIIIFCVLFYLMLIQKGLITKILNKDIFVKLGASSYAIYVTHPLIMAIFNNVILIKYNLFCEKYTLIAFIIEVLCAILFGVITHYFVEKPINKYTQKLNYSN